MSRTSPFDPGLTFRPKMGGRTAPFGERLPSFRSQMARALNRYGGRRARTNRSNQPGRVAVREPRALSRRCVVRARYVPMTTRGLKAAKLHLAYLERDGVERDGSRGLLYGADETFTREVFREPLAREQRQFRFIVSPEDGDRLELKEFTREFMQQVEKDTGRSLIWAAVNHHNTDNPHVHIVIRGVDRDGEDVHRRAVYRPGNALASARSDYPGAGASAGN